MRKVLYRKWIPYEFDGVLGTKKGTNCYTDFIYEGIFHQWAVLDSSAAAIIELPDGTIEIVHSDSIIFLKTNE